MVNEKDVQDVVKLN